jgi:hypothetical protein
MSWHDYMFITAYVDYCLFTNSHEICLANYISDNNYCEDSNVDMVTVNFARKYKLSVLLSGGTWRPVVRSINWSNVVGKRLPILASRLVSLPDAAPDAVSQSHTTTDSQSVNQSC